MAIASQDTAGGAGGFVDSERKCKTLAVVNY